jgi:lipopolysaccharide transport system permease protein
MINTSSAKTPDLSLHAGSNAPHHGDDSGISSARLLKQLVRRALELRFRGSVFGAAWLFLTPVILMGTYVVMFTLVLKSPFHGADLYAHVGSLILGITMFNIVAQPLNTSAGIIYRNTSLVKKVRFPLHLIVIAEYLAAVLESAGCLVILLLWITFFGHGLTATALLFVPLLAFALVLGLGATLLFASLGVVIRDLEQLLAQVTRILLYASAVFYPLASTSPAVRKVLVWNPLVHVVDCSRAVLVQNKLPDWDSVAAIVLFTAISAGLGSFIYIRLRRSFAEFV